MPCRACRPRPTTALGIALALSALPWTGCSDPAPGELCALLAPPSGAMHVLETAADEPLAVGLTAPGIAVLETADDRFQPGAQGLARALRALDRGDDPEAVTAEHRTDAEALDAAVGAHCAS